MKGRTSLTTTALSLLLGAAYVGADTPLVPMCASGSTPRFEIINNCGDDVWVVETPPGNQTQPTVPAQWDWFKAYTTQENPHIPGVVGLLLPKQASQTFCVLDKGAPGGNFRFYMGCPANNTDPFNTGGCMLGAAAGDLAGINTLFEPTFGCDPTLPASECAFNPAAGAPNWPQCQSDPNIAHCPPIAPSNNFDISAVDGYAMLLRVDTQPRAGTHCNRLSTDASMLDLASCPTETNATLYSTDPIQQTHIDSTVSLLNQDDAALKARTRSTQTEAVYETPRGVRPRLKVAVKTQDPETGVMKFAITVHGAVISEPAKCADAPTTELATTFGLLVGSEHVLVGARLAWECHGSTLQTP